jgi:hypothetical protein
MEFQDLVQIVTFLAVMCMGVELPPLGGLLSQGMMTQIGSRANIAANTGAAQMIVGTYVADCENTSWFVPSAAATLNLTSAKSMRYWDNNTFEGEG